MKNYRENLEGQLGEINELIKTLERRIGRRKDLPDVRVRTTISKGRHQYYFINEKTNEMTYVSQKRQREVKILLQQSYDISAKNQLEIMKKRLERFLKTYDVDMLENIYRQLPKGKKEMVNPIIATDEQYIEKWLEEHPGSQNLYYEDGIYKTAKGEMVRSKSEKIIADTLNRYGVPYVYEPMIELKGYHTVYPDFLILNVRERKTIIWEHLGLVSQLEYATKNFEKLQEYE